MGFVVDPDACALASIVAHWFIVFFEVVKADGCVTVLSSPAFFALTAMAPIFKIVFETPKEVAEACR